MNINADQLLEPAKAYKELYKGLFEENAKALFDELVNKSGVDVEENRRLAAKYRDADKDRLAIEKKLRGLKTLRVFLFIFAGIALILIFSGISRGNTILAGSSFAAAAAFIVLAFVVMNPKIKSLKKEYEGADMRAQKFYNEALHSIAPLIDSFDSSMTAGLMQKTVPTLVFDKNYDLRRCDCLCGKYGYAEESGPDSSTLGILSGEILGNPFIFERTLNHRWGSQVYTGTLTIHWTEYERDSDGHMVARHRTQTLTASVRKPKPFFNESTRLVYGNEAAPNLSFSRTNTHAERFSERELKNYVRSHTKKLDKMARKGIDTGFTQLGNEEFDALFGAANRDNEVEFRLLFTPLAQKNMLDIIKGNSPFGDDFDMSKQKCINIISSEHGQKMDINIDISKYSSYDIDICRSQFLQFNAEYFKGVFFDFAPVLSIPLYQQMKAHEYIYKDSYERNYTVRESEVLANLLGKRSLAHPNSVTPAIIKTRLLDKDNDVDELMAQAMSYRTVRRIDFVPVFGGDGRFHQVPVPWLQYIPLMQETRFELKSMGMSEQEYRHSEFVNDTESHVFYHSIFATLGNISGMSDADPDAIDDAKADGYDLSEGDSYFD